MSARLNLTRHYTQKAPRSPTALKQNCKINTLLFDGKSVFAAVYIKCKQIRIV